MVAEIAARVSSLFVRQATYEGIFNLVSCKATINTINKVRYNTQANTHSCNRWKESLKLLKTPLSKYKARDASGWKLVHICTEAKASPENVSWCDSHKHGS